MKRIYTTLLTCCLGLAGLSAQQTVFIGETGYNSLQDAVNAVENGGTIRITGDQTIGSRVNIAGNNSFTVTGENGAKIINNANNSLIILLRTDYKGSATFENLIFDGNNKSTNQAFFESNTSNTLTLRNVEFTNINCSNMDRNCGNFKGSVVLENVTVTNSGDNLNFNEGKNDGITVKGTGNYSVRLENGRCVIADNFTGMVGLAVLDGQFSEDKIAVKNGNAANFRLVNVPEAYSSWELAQSGENVVLHNEVKLTEGPVKNITTDTFFLTLADAITAANPDDVIEVTESVDIADRIIPSVNLTVRGVGENIRLVRKFQNKLYFAARNHLIFENITFDCDNQANDKGEFEVDATGTLTLNNVKFINSASSASSIIYAKDGRTINANGLVISDCNNNIVEVRNGSKLNLSGNNSFGIVCTTDSFDITVGSEGVSNTEAIEITVPASSMVADKIIVKDCVNPSLFSIKGLGEDLELTAKDGNLVIAAKVVELPAIVNETTNTGYATLNDAVDAAAEGDVIVISKDITIADRINPVVAMTIKGGEENPVTITKNFENKLIATGDAAVTYENLVFDCDNKANSNFEFEVNTKGTLTLVNVKIINSATSRNVFNVKGGRNIYLTDVTVENCGIAESVNLNSNAKANLSGNNIVSVLFADNSARIVKAGELTNELPVAIRLTPVNTPDAQTDDANPAESGLDSYTEIVTGAAESDIEKFSILNNGWKLEYKDNALYLASDEVSVIQCVNDASEGLVNVYDLCGRAIRTDVAADAATEGLPRGLYIVGGRKIAVK